MRGRRFPRLFPLGLLAVPLAAGLLGGVAFGYGGAALLRLRRSRR